PAFLQSLPYSSVTYASVGYLRVTSSRPSAPSPEAAEMHVCTALRSKTSPIGPDRPIRVGVLSRLPFTKLDPGRRSRTKCESFSKATGTPTRYRPWKSGAAGKSRARVG